ncbi:MAG: GxxExxY protein [Opitutales bacterium]
MNIQEIIDTVRQTSYETHVFFKNGYLEKVYENALANRLRKKGLKVVQQHPLSCGRSCAQTSPARVARLLMFVVPLW